MLIPLRSVVLSRLSITRSFASTITQIHKPSLLSLLKAPQQPANPTAVIDVRNSLEIALSGRLDDKVINIPLQLFTTPSFLEIFGDTEEKRSLEYQEFKEEHLVPHPLSEEGMETTYIFSCKAGVRSMMAAEVILASGGGKEIMNYPGGSNDWFS